MHIIEKYLEQKSSLSQQVKKLFSDKQIILYALIDLADDLTFCEKWLVATDLELAVVVNNQIINIFPITKVTSIKEVKSLSCTTYLFIENNDSPALFKASFSGRQNFAMGNIKYYVELLQKNNNFHYDPEDNDADSKYQNSILKPITDAKESMALNSNQAIWRLLRYLIPYKKELFIGGSGAVLATLVSLVPAYITGHLIDDIIRPYQTGAMLKEKAMSLAWMLVVTIAATKAAREFFGWLRLRKMSILGEYIARDLRKELFEHLQTLGMDFYSRKQTGSIITRVSSDTDRIWDFIAFGIVEVGISLVMLVSLSVVLVFLDLRLGLIMTLPVPLLIYAIYRHGEVMKMLFLKAWRKWSNLSAILSDTIPGVQVVKAFGQEQKEVKRFGNVNDDCLEGFNVVHQSWTKFWPFLMLGIHLVMVSVWIFALPRLFEIPGNNYISAGKFVSILLYMGMFAAPIEIIGQMSRMLSRALSSAYRIFEILDTKPSIVPNKNPHILKELKGEIEFKQVEFSYDGVRQILSGMSFKVKPGEMIGLVGMSGGGKSTITKLLRLNRNWC